MFYHPFLTRFRAGGVAAAKVERARLTSGTGTTSTSNKGVDGPPMPLAPLASRFTDGYRCPIGTDTAGAAAKAYPGKPYSSGHGPLPGTPELGTPEMGSERQVRALVVPKPPAAHIGSIPPPW